MAPSAGGPQDEAPGGRVRFVTLVTDDGREPGSGLSEGEAAAIWAAVSAPWHPALLARAEGLPRVEDVAFPTPPEAGEVRVVAAAHAARLPSGYRAQAEDAGVRVVEVEGDRPEAVRRLAEALGDEGTPEEDPVALDSLALGSARWWLRDLTIAMGHADCLDVENLAREALAGAREWVRGDRQAAKNHLRGAFELLTQARERFYPVDAYYVDLCLLDPNAPAGALAEALEAHAPFTLVAPARAMEAQAGRDPERLAALREAINEGWADVVGGPYGEADEPLRPIESILWQFRKGYETYRRHLDDRAVETFVRRRFGLYPQLPQVARRFGFRFGLHLALDDGRFPIPPESKRMWEAPDGTSLEAMTRAPVAADRAVEGPHLPWRIGRTLKDDHVATLVVVRWPGQVAGWYRDLRRVAGYSPVFLRWVTVGDYFHLTDRPFEALRPLLDDYGAPYLAQNVARGDPAPISRRAEQAALRGRLDAASNLRALAKALGASEPEAPDWAAAEDACESGRLGETAGHLAALEPAWAGAVAGGIAGASGSGEARPGYLVLNPIGVARRAAVLLPEAALDLRPEGPLRASQFTEDGIWAVVDLPAFGYAWVPRETNPQAEPMAQGAIGVRGRVLRNESLEVEIDEATGGIRSLRAPGEPLARIGQRLVVPGEDAVAMRAERFEVEYGGPALVRAYTEGVLAGAAGEVLGRFRQTYRLWSGRPALEVEIALTDLDTSWLDRLAAGDPWERAIACRWAWPDAEAELRRTSLLAPEPTTARRPETAEVLEIVTRRQHTALLFGGLAHHARHGSRMLDTLLVAGREAGRRFRLGVVLDREFPFQAVQDFLAPAHAVATAGGPPSSGASGWLFHADARGVAVLRAEPLDRTGDGAGWGVAFHLLETSGRASRCRLRLVRAPLWARQTDFNGEPVVDLAVEGDGVTVDLTPHELARVEVILG